MFRGPAEKDFERSQQKFASEEPEFIKLIKNQWKKVWKFIENQASSCSAVYKKASSLRCFNAVSKQLVCRSWVWEQKVEFSWLASH